MQIAKSQKRSRFKDKSKSEKQSKFSEMSISKKRSNYKTRPKYKNKMG